MFTLQVCLQVETLYALCAAAPSEWHRLDHDVNPFEPYIARLHTVPSTAAGLCASSTVCKEASGSWKQFCVELTGYVTTGLMVCVKPVHVERAT